MGMKDGGTARSNYAAASYLQTKLNTYASFGKENGCADLIPSFFPREKVQQNCIGLR